MCAIVSLFGTGYLFLTYWIKVGITDIPILVGVITRLLGSMGGIAGDTKHLTLACLMGSLLMQSVIANHRCGHILPRCKRKNFYKYGGGLEIVTKNLYFFVDFQHHEVEHFLSILHVLDVLFWPKLVSGFDIGKFIKGNEHLLLENIYWVDIKTEQQSWESKYRRSLCAWQEVWCCICGPICNRKIYLAISLCSWVSSLRESCSRCLITRIVMRVREVLTGKACYQFTTKAHLGDSPSTTCLISKVSAMNVQMIGS